MPLERPRREPLVGPDGQLPRSWANWFDEQASTNAGNVVTVGTLNARLTVAEADVVALEARATALESDTAELRFLMGF